jgi:energy-coupling factor transporter ATP-binding protein EcfA2
MAEEDLFKWCQGRPVWQQAMVSMLTGAAELSDEEYDGFRVALKQEHKIIPGTPGAWPTLTKTHLKSDASTAPVTILGSIGPLKNIDRLAGDQPPLQFAVAGITLIYGANGSGKSGYCRIAKKLCRCLHDISLRGNVYQPAEVGPREIELAFRVNGQAKQTVTWNDNNEPPPEFGRISVFDSDAAGLYVDNERNIEFLPFELSLLTNFVTALKKLEASFEPEQTQLKALVKAPLPSGYGENTSVTQALALLIPGGALPKETELRALAAWTEELEAELQALIAKRTSDPALLLRVTKALMTITGTLSGEVAAAIEAVGPDSVSKLLADREAARVARAAAKAIADGLFDGSAVPNLDNESWRQMLSHARQFALEAFPAAEAPPLANADVCVLCHQPLQPEAKQRLLKFDEYIAGKANDDAESARKTFAATARRFTQFICESPEALAKKLESFIDVSPQRKALADRVVAFFGTAIQRGELVASAIRNQDDGGLEALPELDLELVAALDTELASLALLAASYKPTTEQTDEHSADAKRVEELEARKKFSSDIETFVERLANLELLGKTKLCIDACASGPITTYITRMRRQQLTPTLRENFKAEILAFDLQHLPLDLSDRGDAGKSKVQIGLEVRQKIKRNSDILSEGEKRALALAGFLAEIKEIGAHHGIIIDDPVSSLDHSRIESVAKRLVEEAKTGRQVIIFTHNLVFHHAVRSAARGMPLREEWIAKHGDGRFGIIDEGQKPWVSLNCKKRLNVINQLLTLHRKTYTETDENNRSFVVEIYTKLRETWEHSIEEILFAGVIGRFRPEVQTLKLRAARIEEEDYQVVLVGMTRCSKFSGHDQSLETPPDLPKFADILVDIESLTKFVKESSLRHDQLEKAGKQSEVPLEAEVM